MNRPKIFVSSTIYDFQDLRSALKYWLQEYGYETQLSEYNDFQKDLTLNSYDACLKSIENCDYFILLIGGRRGGLYPGEDISISVIKEKNSVYKHLYEIDDWEFFYYDGTTAKKKSLLNRFNDMRCYLIEESFDNRFETRWESIKDSFLDEAKRSYPLPGERGERIISEQTAKNMMKFFFMMYCRSPQFDPMDTYSWMENILKETFTESNAEIDEMMDAVWFTELYRIFFKQSGGFYHSVLAKSVEQCQMILFETHPNAGAFITSDNPAFRHVSVVETNNINGLYFPIDPNHLLFIAKGDDKINKIDYRMADTELIKKFNNIIASHKINTLIANTKNSQSFL